ncbi:MAG: anthranilate phosphoribosyltransferase [Deferribacteres bacterium]|nr:anthranilate phosphoribosyltransferase [candidate division KSB1 bacterium]MCB9501811.1 anthranilate phosphoribosyltransferase [Deferribacteres bacterium]
MLKSAISKAIDFHNLSRQDAFDAMHIIMSGQASETQIAAFLVAMRMKKETVDEITGFADCMRQHATPVKIDLDANPIDIVGTGGDGKHTFNISTVSAIVIAGAGVPVAKHGNRSVSSKCGSADVLAELGVKTDLNADQMAQCVAEAGIAFLFAPMLHPAMKYAIGPRRELAARTVFNILGPITNPAGVKRQVIGVYDAALMRPLADVLQALGSEHILLVHSDDGLDEISLAAPTKVVELKNNEISEYKIKPEDFNISRNYGTIIGADAAENARIATGVLNGEDGPARGIVLLNSAAGLYVSGRVQNLMAGVQKAAESIDSGAATKKLDQLVEVSNSIK